MILCNLSRVSKNQVGLLRYFYVCGARLRLLYVLLFNVGKRRQKPLRVQRYNKYLIYANLFAKYMQTRIKLREKDEDPEHRNHGIPEYRQKK